MPTWASVRQEWLNWACCVRAVPGRGGETLRFVVALGLLKERERERERARELSMLP